MSEGDPRIPPICPEENGLRETFLIGLPSDIGEPLRQTTVGVYRLAARHGLLYGDPELDRDAAEMVGLWRELGFLKGLAGHYERQAQGLVRESVRDIRVLLEEAEALALLLLPEGFS